MRITDVAKMYGVTDQAVRNRIKSAGYSIDTLRVQGKNTFTPEGEKIVLDLYKNNPVRNQSKPEVKKNKTVAELRKENAQLQIDIAALRATAESQLKQIEFFQENYNNMQKNFASLQANVNKMQDNITGLTGTVLRLMGSQQPKQETEKTDDTNESPNGSVDQADGNEKDNGEADRQNRKTTRYSWLSRLFGKR